MFCLLCLEITFFKLWGGNIRKSLDTWCFGEHWMKLINLHTANYGEHLLSGDQIILSNNFDRRVNIGHSPCRNVCSFWKWFCDLLDQIGPHIKSSIQGSNSERPALAQRSLGSFAWTLWWVSEVGFELITLWPGGRSASHWPTACIQPLLPAKAPCLLQGLIPQSMAGEQSQDPA